MFAAVGVRVGSGGHWVFAAWFQTVPFITFCASSVFCLEEVLERHSS